MGRLYRSIRRRDLRHQHPQAPWNVIPSNHKWFRNLAVSQIMADSMEALGMAFPKPSVDLAEIRPQYYEAVGKNHEDNR